MGFLKLSYRSASFLVSMLASLSLATLLSACGSSTTPNDSLDFASTSIPVEKAIVKCNKAGSSTLSYKSAAQISGTGFDPNIANIYLSNLPTDFEAGQSFIQFWKGQAISDSTLGFSTTAISFAIYDRQISRYLNNGQTYSSLKWNDVKNLIPGATAANFMSRAIFVLFLQDTTGAFQVLSAASYRTSDNSVIEGVASLIPTFYANPADYATKSNGQARETVLRNLHPLKNQSGDFATLAQNICQ